MFLVDWKTNNNQIIALNLFIFKVKRFHLTKDNKRIAEFTNILNKNISFIIIEPQKKPQFNASYERYVVSINSYGGWYGLLRHVDSGRQQRSRASNGGDTARL